MPLNIVSNSAANTALRNLTVSDSKASGSVAKLSSGSRVLAAKDDAAALAIGSRLRAEVAAQQQASVNAGQAVSLLQIADGALSEINNTLVRLKSLAVQAGSDQLGSTERALIDTEFQQLVQEVDRIAQDTEFNGQQLIAGGTLSSLVQLSDPGTDGISGVNFSASVEDNASFQYSYSATEEVLTVTKLGNDAVTTSQAQSIDAADVTTDGISFTFGENATGDVFSYQFDSATEQLTVVNESTGETQAVDIESAFESAFGETVNTVSAGETLDIAVAGFDLTVTLQEGFDRTVNITAANVVDDATIDTNQANVNAVTTVDFNRNAALLDGDGYAALTNLTNFDTSTGELTITATVVANGTDQFTLGGLAGFAYDAGAAGADSATITATANTVLNFNGTAVGTLNLAGVDLAGATDGGTFDIVVSLEGIIVNDQTVTRTADETIQIDVTADLDAVAGAGNNLAFDQTLDVSYDQFGVTLTLDKGFDRGVDIVSTTAVQTATLPAEVTNASFVQNDGFVSADAYQALLDLGYDSTTGIGYNANTGVLSLQVSDDTAGAGGVVTFDALTGVDFGLGVGNEGFDLTGTASTTDISIQTADGSTVKLGTLTADYVNTSGAGSLGTVDIQIGKGVFFNDVDPTASITELTFKIGTGNLEEDRITLALDAATTEALGINGTDVTTADNANAASDAISDAITVLNRARANVGAFQNRLEIATNNLATTIENTEAARSALLDLNVAQEVVKFTSQQILVQAGVSTLAQANQLPQNLLRLLQ